jgi:hypothetical protein
MTAAKLAIRAIESLGLAAIPTIRQLQVSTASPPKKGAPAYGDGNGYIAATAGTVSVSSHTVIGAAGASDILGFLEEDGAISTASEIGVVPAIPGQIFEGNLVDTTIALCAATIAQTDLFAHMGLAKPSGETHYGVDKGIASSRDCVQVVGFTDPVNTVNGRVKFVVRAGWRQWDE